MKKILMIGLCTFIMILNMLSTAEEVIGIESLTLEQNSLVEYAREQADILTDALTNNGLLTRTEYQLEDEVVSLLISTDYSTPVAVFLILPNDCFDADEIFKKNGSQQEMENFICFSVAHDANILLCTDKSFHNWSRRMSMYGIMEDCPYEIAYIELVYDSNAPQIVTAFCRDESNRAITQTSFVYNPNFFPEAIYATLPVVAQSSWEQMNTFFIKMPSECPQ